MLKVTDLHVSYGAIHAIHGISLEVNEGEIVSLIGANGAGKTTTLHTISGLKKATSGEVSLEGHNLLATDPAKIITLGMWRTSTAIFPVSRSGINRRAAPSQAVSNRCWRSGAR